MADLDRLFRAMQSDADLVPSAEVSVVRAFGRRRRVRHNTAILVTIAVVVGTVLVGPRLWSRPAPPPADVPPTTVTFTPLRTVGAESLRFDAAGSGRPTTVATAVADGRGYVLWQGDDAVPTVAALDLATGRRLWGPITLDLPQGWTAVYASPQAVAILSVSGSYTTGMITVLDPTTGETRWHRTLHASDGVAYEPAFVIADRSTGVTEAVDWRSGRTLWTVTDPSGSLVTVLGMRTSEDMSAPGPYPMVPFSDHRLVEVGGDHVVRVYDAINGQLLGSRTALGNETLAYNGTVFAVRDATSTAPNQVLAYQAVGTDVPRVVYQSPHDTSGLRSLTPCGSDRICLVEGYGINGGADAEVVGVDVNARAAVWRTKSGNLDYLAPMGERVLGRTSDGKVGLYGADSATVLLPRDSPDIAERVDASSVLRLWSTTNDAAHSAADVDVVGVAVSTGEQVPLGRIRIWLTSCSWDARYLLCGTDTGFQVWRFNAD